MPTFAPVVLTDPVSAVASTFNPVGISANGIAEFAGPGDTAATSERLTIQSRFGVSADVHTVKMRQPIVTVVNGIPLVDSFCGATVLLEFSKNATEPQRKFARQRVLAALADGSVYGDAADANEATW